MSLGLYLHIPYCFSKCRYCDFYSHPGERGVPDAYVDALLRELARFAPDAPLRPDTVYFGGGTPSLLSPAQVGRLIRAACPVSGAEVTLEANPEDQSTLRASLPSPFDEVVAGTSGSLPSSAPARRSIGAATNAQDLSFDEAPVDEPVLIAPVETNAGSADNAPLRDIPAVDSEDPAQAEDEVSELVVRARKILSDLPGPIAPKE